MTGKSADSGGDWLAGMSGGGCVLLEESDVVSSDCSLEVGSVAGLDELGD